MSNNMVASVLFLVHCALSQERGATSMWAGPRSLTLSRLKDLLHYDPEAGVFTWLSSDCRIKKTGKQAGLAVERGGHHRIRIDGVRYLAQRLAWLYTNEDWPVGHIKPVDGNASNLRRKNWVDCRDMLDVKRQKRSANHAQWRKRNPEKWRSNNLKVNFGIDWDEYQRMLKAQDGVCAICLSPETYKTYTDVVPRPLAVDHDHADEAIRGLLCRKCNGLLAYARDSIDILSSAIRYLKEHNAATSQRKIAS